MIIKMFTKTGCSYCDLAKHWFRTNNIAVEVVTLDDQLDRQRLYEDIGHGAHTMPQIFLGDRWLGGYTELLDHQDTVQAEALKQGSGLSDDF